MASVTAGLREYAERLRGRGLGDDDRTVLLHLADLIDAEHAVRMEQCRRETMRRCLHRVRSMMNDMERGVKCARKEQNGG